MLGTKLDRGLGDAVAGERLAHYGPNTPTEAKQRSALAVLADQLFINGCGRQRSFASRFRLLPYLCPPCKLFCKPKRLLSPTGT